MEFSNRYKTVWPGGIIWALANVLTYDSCPAVTTYRRKTFSPPSSPVGRKKVSVFVSRL
jgi:hypothetical protein